MTITLGAVADDFTGATDLANTLVGAGMSCVQLIGVPQGDVDLRGVEAVVIALKSRTAPVAQAVAESLAATRWLVDHGARQVLSKYCSTFDSTPQGNIGPIADAMMVELGADFALVCPAFPETGRSIYKGHLFVGDQLLSDSPMKDHPLTPMRDSDLVRLMSAQSDRSVGLIPWQVVRAGADAIRDRIESLRSDGVQYGVIDVIADADLMTIGQVARDHRLVTGGSGIALGLPAAWRQGAAGQRPAMPKANGRSLILAGSCSAATRAQLAHVPADWPLRKITAQEAMQDATLVEELVTWAQAQPCDVPCVIYSSADPDEVAQGQEAFGVAEAGARIEQALSGVAHRLAGNGFGQLIVAGGETSGAVVSALGVSALRIGPKIAPGVPWCETLGGPHLALALKSGNFGGPEFFADALEMLE